MIKSNFIKCVQRVLPCLVLLPLLLTGCSYFGVYTGGQVKELTQEFYERGIEEGRAHEIRTAEHVRQEELTQRQVTEKFYRVYVPPHVNEQGVKVEGHSVPIKIVTE